MRRKDREITDLNEILEVIKASKVCRLSLFDEEYPYIIPLSFAHYVEEGRITLYFHGAAEGKKLELIARNNCAAFEMDILNKVCGAEKPCAFNMEYESVVGNGRIAILPKVEKAAALKIIMEKFAPGRCFEFGYKEIEETCVYKLTVDNIYGKRLKNS